MASPGGRVRYAFPAWRIFVHGVEVTDDVTTTNANYHDARAPNLTDITLVSPRDRYIVLPEDIHTLYNSVTPDQLGAGLYSEEAFTDAVRQNLTKVIDDPIKRRVLASKANVRIKGVTQPSTADPFEDVANESPSKGFTGLSGDALRFPFQVGQCIFHTGDPVRVFFRDPFDASAWYFEATGSVADWREDADEKGRRIVTLTVEDATRPFRMARVALNPALYDVNVVADQRFDTLIRNWHVDYFKDMTLSQAMNTIVFGPEAFVGPLPEGDAPSVGSDFDAPAPVDQARYGVEGSTAYRVTNASMRAVGFFNKKDSGVFVFGPPGSSNDFLPSHFQAIDSLEAWQDVVDHRVPTTIDELMKLCIDTPEAQSTARSAFTAALAEEDPVQAVIKEIGEHPERYPVDYGRFLMLIPASLGPSGNLDIFLRDFGGIADQTEFLTRLQIIYGICERLNFSFYATPRGDIVCEMPLYSFRPEDFGKYAPRYLFPVDDTISVGSHFQHDKVRTLILADRAALSNRRDTGYASQYWGPPGAAPLRSLIPQFGMVSERAEPWVYSNTPEAVKYYCELRLSRTNSDAWTQSISTVMRAGLGPNRPCWFEARDFIACLRGVTDAVSWGKSGSVSQQLKLNYRRGWAGQLTRDGKHVYEPYGGFMADPLNFALLFRHNEDAQSTMSDTSEAHEHQEAKDSTVAENEAYMLRQAQVIADAFGEAVGQSVDARDIIGSFTRTEAQDTAARVANAARRGQTLDISKLKHGKHTEGLAFDIPRSKLKALGPNGLNPEQAYNIIWNLMNEGKIGRGAGSFLQAEVNGERVDPSNPNVDHLHFQVSHAAKDTKSSWNEGEGQ